VKYPVYPSYRPSGVEWLGTVPVHWDTKHLRYVCRFAYGDSLAAEDREEGSIGVYGSNGAVGTHVTGNTQKPVIVVGRKGSHGKVNFSEQEVFAIDTTYFIDRRHTRANLRWLFYVLVTLGLDAVSKDSAVPGLAREDAYEHYLATPTAEEQFAIADFLDRETAKLDKLVGKKRALIEKLKEKRTALISRTVTRGLPPDAARAAGLNPHPKLKPSGIQWLGDVPEHWEVKLLKRAAAIEYGVGGEIDRSLEEGLRTISLPNIDIDGRLNVDDVPYSDVSEAEKRSVLLRKGDLLFNWRNGSPDHLGKTALFNESGEYSHVSFLLRIRFDQGRYCPAFFRYLLNGYRITGFFKHSKAGVNNTFNLSELAALPVVCPSLREQLAVAEYLNHETTTIDRMVEKVEQAIERLQEYRTALITAAVTGKIDVRDVGERSESATANTESARMEV
jgi:type I restriction enzyme S subunit